MYKLSALIGVVFVLGTAGLVVAQDKAGAVARGKAVYLSAGCWQCHGYVGQGGAGAKLAPGPLPAEAIINFVRNSTKNMPAYSEKAISDAELTDIHAFLESLPASKAADSIPLLKNLKPPQ